MSDDGSTGLVVIAMLGSAFSPRYARARELGPSDPLAFAAFNVAVYGTNPRWALSEGYRPEVAARSLVLGANNARWVGEDFVVDIEERGTPVPRPIRGRVVVRPTTLDGSPQKLDARGQHRWYPIAPTARATVELDAPRIAFQGAAYLDANRGDLPLERTFDSWSWYRASGGGKSSISYRAQSLQGETRSIALASAAGGLRPTSLTGSTVLPETRWGLTRECRVASGSNVRLIRTLEDTPFYARTQIEIARDGDIMQGVHETLSLRRFSAPWVRFLLPARIRQLRPRGHDR